MGSQTEPGGREAGEGVRVTAKRKSKAILCLVLLIGAETIFCLTFGWKAAVGMLLTMLALGVAADAIDNIMGLDAEGRS